MARTVWVALLVALLCVSAVRGSEEVSDPDVVVLTEKNWDSIVPKEDLVLVEFYAPWCGHCKSLAPEYAKAATTLKAHDPPIMLAKVDATIDSGLASKFEVRGYPTMKIFRNGQPSDYQGPREANGIVSYMKKQSGPSSTKISSVEQLEAFQNKEEPVVIGFFTSEGKGFKEFMGAANSLRDKFKWAHTTDPAVLDAAGYREAVVLFKPYDEKKLVYKGESNARQIEEWVFKNNLPLAGILTKDNVELYQRKGHPIVRVLATNVDGAKNKKQADYYLNRLRKVAKDFPKLSFVVANKNEFNDGDRFGLDGSEKDPIVIEDHNNNAKYRLAGEKFSAESVKKFVSDFEAGALKPHIKTEPRPAPAKKGEVVVATGETFNEIVMDKNKDVLVEFYAPWCGHCKQLAPKYDKLAKELEDQESIAIVKFDATANDIPHPAYQARGYPTILFAPANNKDRPLKYEGEREVKAFKKWLKEKSALPWGSKK